MKKKQKTSNCKRCLPFSRTFWTCITGSISTSSGWGTGSIWELQKDAWFNLFLYKTFWKLLNRDVLLLYIGDILIWNACWACWRITFTTVKTLRAFSALWVMFLLSPETARSRRSRTQTKTGEMQERDPFTCCMARLDCAQHYQVQAFKDRTGENSGKILLLHLSLIPQSMLSLLFYNFQFW